MSEHSQESPQDPFSVLFEKINPIAIIKINNKIKINDKMKVAIINKFTYLDY